MKPETVGISHYTVFSNSYRAISQRLQPQPDFVAANGDLSQDGTPRIYELLQNPPESAGNAHVLVTW